MFSPKRSKSDGSNPRTGKPETRPDASAHTRGVKQGNLAGRKKKEKGLLKASDGAGAKATARRSTSINPEARDPIDPSMPNLPPP